MKYRAKLRADAEAESLLRNVALDLNTSVSPVMLVLLKLRAKQYLRYGAEAIREARQYDPGSLARHTCTLEAQRFLGVAEGTIYALYDTATVAWRYLRALSALRRALRQLVEPGRT